LIGACELRFQMGERDVVSRDELAENATLQEIAVALYENPTDDLNCVRLWMGSVVVKILWNHRIVHNSRPRISRGAEQLPPSIDLFSE